LTYPEYKFPEAFLETGKDEDHSYLSLKTTREPDGKLRLDVEGWGMAASGLYLLVERGMILKLYIMGECGTMSDNIWVKVSLNRIVEEEDEDRASHIECCDQPAAGTEQIIYLTLKKQPPQTS
jgi:hypothetical protein